MKRALVVVLSAVAVLAGGCFDYSDAAWCEADAGRCTDAGATDAGTVDGGSTADAGAVDSGVAADAGTTDAGGPADAGGNDAGSSSDAGVTDAGSGVPRVVSHSSDTGTSGTPLTLTLQNVTAGNALVLLAAIYPWDAGAVPQPAATSASGALARNAWSHVVDTSGFDKGLAAFSAFGVAAGTHTVSVTLGTTAFNGWSAVLCEVEGISTLDHAQTNSGFGTSLTASPMTPTAGALVFAGNTVGDPSTTTGLTQTTVGWSDLWAQTNGSIAGYAPLIVSTTTATGAAVQPAWTWATGHTAASLVISYR